MRPFWKDLLLAAILGLVLPWLLLHLILYFREEKGITDTPEMNHTQIQPQEYAVCMTMYLRGEDGTVKPMDMDTYLTGVILAELPASFELEAKKAQAVAARTFAWKAVTTGGKHGDGSVCTDSRCCQAYITPEKYTGTEDAIREAAMAVQATSGYVLTYEDELIEATYFSCSGGSTEEAVAVWGMALPYLQAKESPGEENATHYRDTVVYSQEEFCRRLEISPDLTPEGWFGLTTYTAGGGVAAMEICGRVYQGTELRKLLNLKSTAFTVAVEDEQIIVTTKGYGHRVGMSQYGADAMAVGGSTYREILMYYYEGAELTFLAEN